MAAEIVISGSDVGDACSALNPCERIIERAADVGNKILPTNFIAINEFMLTTFPCQHCVIPAGICSGGFPFIHIQIFHQSKGREYPDIQLLCFPYTLG